MRFRATVVGLVLIPALAAACSSSGGGSAPPSSNPAPVSPGATGSSAPAGPAAALAATLRKGLTGLTSAHLVVDAGALGGTSAGDVAYGSDGQATGSDVTLTSGTEKTEIVTVGTTSYAKLPAGRNTSGKPWVKVSADSKNEFVRALSTSVDISKAAASLPAIVDVVTTSSSATKSGNTYSLVVEPAKSASTSLGKLLATIGQQSVPVKITLDAKGRPTKIVITVKIGTQSFDVVISVSKFDAPVSISAPPASQVAS